MKNQNFSQNNDHTMQGFTFMSSSSQIQQSMISCRSESACFIKAPHDDQLTTISSTSFTLAQILPGKVYENCQRTARVIMLSQLEKTVAKDKKLKLLLSKILSEFMPNKNQTESSSEYSNKKGYYESLHYSRVRIGQRQFLKNILLNSQFKEIFQILFQNKAFETSQKARKNQRSQISFEKRRQIISNIIQQYEKKFQTHFNIATNQAQEAINKKNKEATNKKQVGSQQKQSIQKLQQFQTIAQLDQKVLVKMLVLPIIPIPLFPAQYESWQKSRPQSQ